MIRTCSPFSNMCFGFGFSFVAVTCCEDLLDLVRGERRRLLAGPTKPVTFGVFFTRCHDSSDISISTRM